MDRAALRAQFRSEADDSAEPYLFDDTEVNDWINQAEEEAAARADLLLEVDDATVCTLAVTAGTSAYALHAKVCRVTFATFTPTGETTPVQLKLINRVELDRIYPTWREDTDTPVYLLTEGGKARLVPKPVADGSLQLEVFRLPLEGMALDNDTPEIQDMHHRHLVDWVLFRAYSKPDTETQDLPRAAAAEGRFERRFGLRRDADMGQAAEAVPFNKPWF